jgi:hypothetical protein
MEQLKSIRRAAAPWAGSGVLRLIVPARILVDDLVPEARRPPIVEAVRAALNGRDEDGLIAIVSRLPDGRLRVFVNHIEDPSFVATVEAALARL